MIARRGIDDIVYGPAFGSIAARRRVAGARVLTGIEIRLSSVVTASCRIRAHKLHGFAASPAGQTLPYPVHYDLCGWAGADASRGSGSPVRSQRGCHRYLRPGDL